MSTPLIPDPLQMWRDAVTKLESNVNSLVTGSMESPEVVRSLHQFRTVSLGMEQAFEKAIGSYLSKVNLPSRKDIADLAATLQRIEDKLDRVLPAPPQTALAPRPPRTRRPPAPATTAPQSPPEKAAPTKPRRGAKRRGG